MRSALHHRAHEQHSLLREEDIFRDGGNTARTAHARRVPVVDDFQVRNRYDGRDYLETAVIHLHESRIVVPRAVLHPGVELPRAVDDIAAIGRNGYGAGGENSADARVRVREYLILRLIGE